MYAIIKTGGKQYRVKKDAIIDVELLNHAEEGKEVLFDDVLFVFDGDQPLLGQGLTGFVVKGELMGQAKGPKIVSLKYKKRKRSYKKWGHRQRYSRIKITAIGKEK